MLYSNGEGKKNYAGYVLFVRVRCMIEWATAYSTMVDNGRMLDS